MKKFLAYSIILVILIGVFAPITTNATAESDCKDKVTTTNISDRIIALAACEKAAGTDTALGNLGASAASNVGGAAGASAKAVSSVFVTGALIGPMNLIMGLVSMLLYIAAAVLGFVIDKTILNMSVNIAGITGINTAWTVVRDVANIAFVFLLMFEGLKMILGIGGSSKEKAGGIIGMIVLTALLINFSLFFTKVIIDASNIVTIGFYQSIDAAKQTSTVNAGSGTNSIIDYGMAGAIMNKIGLMSIYTTDTWATIKGAFDYSLVTTMAFSSVLILILAFTFFSMAIMLIIRYFVLIFLLILSPLGFLGFGLPALKKTQDEWWESLKGQALFAPTFMFMMWITLTIISSPSFSVTPGSSFASLFGGKGGKADIGSIGLMVNYIIIIGMTMMSLTLAKTSSKRGSKIIGDMMGKATAFAGGVVFGGAAAVATNTAGRLGSRLANSEYLKDRAVNGSFLGKVGAKFAMKTGDKASDKTFDMRSLGLLGGLDAGKVDSKATFKGKLKAKTEEEEKFAKSLEPSALEKAEAKAKVDNYEKSLKEEFEKPEFKGPPPAGTPERAEFDATDEGKRYKIYETVKNGSRAEEDIKKNDADIKTSTDKVKDTEKTKTAKEKEIEKLEKEKEGTSGDERTAINAKIDTIKNEIGGFDTLIKEEKEKQKKLEEFNKLNKENKKLYDSKAWMPAEIEELIAKSGGRKADESKGIKGIESLYSQRVNKYADNLEKHDALKRFSELPFNLAIAAATTIGPGVFFKGVRQEAWKFNDKTNRKIATSVRKLSKEKTADELMVEQVKKEAKEKKDKEDKEKPEEPKKEDPKTP